MNSKEKNRYEAAAYISIICLSLLLVAASLFIPWTTVRNLLVNLAASLLAVCVLFFLLNKFFLLPSIDNPFVDTFLTNERAREVFSLHERLKKAVTLDVLGYNLRNFLEEFRDDVISCVQRGGTVRILVVDPLSTAGQVIVQNSRLGLFLNNSAETENIVRNYIEQRLQESRLPEGAQFCFSKVNWIPSCSLIIVGRSPRTSVMKLAFNTAFYRTPRPRGRLNIVLEHTKHPYWFEFFAEQFSQLWEDATVSSLLPNMADDSRTCT